MEKKLHTEITINATPERVWEILTDYKAYPIWNPFLKSLEGDVLVGKQIKVHITPPDGKAMMFKPRVISYEKNSELKWLSHLWIKGLFDGEHRFQLIRNSDNTTTFIHSEKFNGLLVSLFSKMIENNTRRGFEAMNRELKKLAEL